MSYKSNNNNFGQKKKKFDPGKIESTNSDGKDSKFKRGFSKLKRSNSGSDGSERYSGGFFNTFIRKHQTSVFWVGVVVLVTLIFIGATRPQIKKVSAVQNAFRNQVQLSNEDTFNGKQELFERYGFSDTKQAKKYFAARGVRYHVPLNYEDSLRTYSKLDNASVDPSSQLKRQFYHINKSPDDLNGETLIVCYGYADNLALKDPNLVVLVNSITKLHPNAVVYGYSLDGFSTASGLYGLSITKMDSNPNSPNYTDAPVMPKRVPQVFLIKNGKLDKKVNKELTNKGLPYIKTFDNKFVVPNAKHKNGELKLTK